MQIRGYCKERIIEIKKTTNNVKNDDEKEGTTGTDTQNPIH